MLEGYFLSQKRDELAITTPVNEFNLRYVETLNLNNSDNCFGDSSFKLLNG